MRQALLALVVSALAALPAFAQSAADFRIRADFRNPDNGAWGANESVGNADFRVRGSFTPTFYYGGVQRVDDFDFNVQIDFRDIAGFSTQFASSPYNASFDLYINNTFAGRVPMSTGTPGLASLIYRSRLPVLPELPLPANFPNPVNIGSTVRVFTAAPALPAIGSALPTTGTPIFTSIL